MLTNEERPAEAQLTWPNAGGGGMSKHGPGDAKGQGTQERNY